MTQREPGRTRFLNHPLLTVDLESSQLAHGVRRGKLAVMALSAAVRLMQLTLAREGGSTRPATDAFAADEINVSPHVQPTREGKTEKQKNPPLDTKDGCIR